MCRHYHVLILTVVSLTSNHIISTLSQLPNYQNTTARLDNTCYLVGTIISSSSSLDRHGAIQTTQRFTVKGHAVLHAPSCRLTHHDGRCSAEMHDDDDQVQGVRVISIDEEHLQHNSTATPSTGRTLPPLPRYTPRVEPKVLLTHQSLSTSFTIYMHDASSGVYILVVHAF